MIRISTIGHLIEYGFGLNAHCEACNRYAPVSIEEGPLVAAIKKMLH